MARNKAHMSQEFVNLRDWHWVDNAGKSPSGLRGPGGAWRLTSLGIERMGGGVFRTRGEPVTLRRIKEVHGERIEQASIAFDRMIPEPLLAAVIATESGGKDNAFRDEGWDCSPGIMQTLTRTAKAMESVMESRASAVGVELRPLPDRYVQTNDRDEELISFWKIALWDHDTSLFAGAATIYRIMSKLPQPDPILIYAAYNAGDIYVNEEKLFGLHHFGDALEHFAEWYGDACDVWGYCA